MFIVAVCDSPCPFGGECVAEPNTCNCTSVTTSTGKQFMYNHSVMIIINGHCVHH